MPCNISAMADAKIGNLTKFRDTINILFLMPCTLILYPKGTRVQNEGTNCTLDKMLIFMDIFARVQMRIVIMGQKRA